eukprot:scaffold407247_cov38-Prasinocladus_malaysianus.AAC.1
MKATRTSKTKTESATPRRASVSERPRRLSQPRASSGSQMSIAAISIPPREIRGIQKVFRALDKDKDGLVPWMAIQKKCPSLPKEPAACGRFLGMDLSFDSQFDLPMLLRVLYQDITPADAKTLAKMGAHDKGFILPEDKKQEIEDLFKAFDTSMRGVLGPAALVWGLMRTGYDAEQIAGAYISLMTTAEEGSGSRKGISLEQFQDWYIDDVLSDSFKNANIGRKP